MPTLRIQCTCGQRYSFYVEPLNRRMPWAVKCPTCGVDGTNAANELLAQSPSDPPPLQAPVASLAEPPLEDDPGPSYPGTQTLNPQLTAEEAGEAHATNPGRLRPDWGQLLRNAPIVWQAPLVFIVAGILGGWLLNPWLFCLAPAGLYCAWDDYRNITRLLLSGDVCPTLILGENPGRVAVLTNLSATGGSYPVLRIFPEPLSKLAGGPHRRGDRLASVAFYAGPIDQNGNWKALNPSVINRFVSNPEQIQRAVSSIPEETWQYTESVAPNFASEADGLYALAGPTPGPIPLFTHGERRALRVAGGLVGVIAIGIACLLLISHRSGDGTGSQQAGEAGAHGREVVGECVPMQLSLSPLAGKGGDRKLVCEISHQHTCAPDVMHGIGQREGETAIRLAHRAHGATIEEGDSQVVISHGGPVEALDITMGGFRNREGQIAHAG